VVGYGDVGKGSAQSLRQEGMIVKVTEVDPICAMQACLDGFEIVSTYNEGDVSKGVNSQLLANTDMLVTTTGNYNVCGSDVLSALKSGCVVCNIGHFDNEIDTAFMRENWEWDEIKPQVHKVYRDRDSNDHLLLLAEGRLVNLGNATGHPSQLWMVLLPIRYWLKLIYIRNSLPFKMMPQKLKCSALKFYQSILMKKLLAIWLLGSEAF